MCMHVYVSVSVSVSVSVYVCMYMYNYICIYIYIYSYTYTHTYQAAAFMLPPPMFFIMFSITSAPPTSCFEICAKSYNSTKNLLINEYDKCTILSNDQHCVYLLHHLSATGACAGKARPL